mmetsp:Transcript_7451/g.18518  ORF Transcript_7451/g.18518 Transcript_7451/m.18518 type:complete len:264 (+) Transcript_7451:338-1129(+)
MWPAKHLNAVVGLDVPRANTRRWRTRGRRDRCSELTKLKVFEAVRFVQVSFHDKDAVSVLGPEQSTIAVPKRDPETQLNASEVVDEVRDIARDASVVHEVVGPARGGQPSTRSKRRGGKRRQRRNGRSRSKRAAGTERGSPSVHHERVATEKREQRRSGSSNRIDVRRKVGKLPIAQWVIVKIESVDDDRGSRWAATRPRVIRSLGKRGVEEASELVTTRAQRSSKPRALVEHSCLHQGNWVVNDEAIVEVDGGLRACGGWPG